MCDVSLDAAIAYKPDAVAALYLAQLEALWFCSRRRRAATDEGIV